MAEPRVVVFGATVAGLTAAHELARRGFDVSVVVAPGEVRGGPASQGWMPRQRIAPFAAGGKSFPRTGPLPADVCADPIAAGARHLLDTLANIPSATRRKTVAQELVDQPWRPLRRPGSPLPIHPRKAPGDVAEIVDGAKAFVAAGYTQQDGLTFVARILRYLTSSARRRETECQTVSMLDYLRGANASAVPANCEYSPTFLADLADLPDPSTGTRPSITDAHTGLGAYAQWLTIRPDAKGASPRRFKGSIRDTWFEPWIAHLRTDLGVKFLPGRLAHLAGPGRVRRGRTGATITARVTGGSAPTRRLIAQARYLIVATDAANAESACARLPPLGIPGQLRGFSDEVARTAAGPVADEMTRWQRMGGVQLFLPDRLGLEGPLAVVGSPWRLVIRPQLAFHPRPPVTTRDRHGCVLSVDIGAWETPSPRIGKAAVACDERQLAREVWAQIDQARTLRTRARLRPPSWFAVDSRIELSRSGKVRSVARRLLCLPDDWVKRPGPEPRAGRAAAARPGRAPLWTDKQSGGWVHWNCLVFAGDYLKTRTRATGPEAACESGRRAANAVISHAHLPPAADAIPRFAETFDPEADELAALTDLKKLDDWCARERLPHPFALAGVDGWISLVSWFGVLYPVSEPFLKTILEKLVAMARAPSGSTNATRYQEAVLEALRNLREGLQRESRHAPA